tara:strand:- start:4 stop:237 length:234 start_codon:yes stop_codon:yes gene_type:complete
VEVIAHLYHAQFLLVVAVVVEILEELQELAVQRDQVVAVQEVVVVQELLVVQDVQTLVVVEVVDHKQVEMVRLVVQE